ncbi:uncharacterized protein KRP23_11331 [Phytophthora ramorum]|uniref:uncharacterized protein n=1 Tax=Phytophthora ramorum TaxID=164328 RepID=UPI0030B4A207|nr:hypothetical protein KRP23_11331 [Phytophthora ramorum]
MWGLVTSTFRLHPISQTIRNAVPRFPPRTYKDPITRALLSRRPRKSRSPSVLLLSLYADAIVPVMMATAFSVDKRFLCEITTEDLRLYNLISIRSLDAIVRDGMLRSVNLVRKTKE